MPMATTDALICIHGNGFACDSCYDHAYGKNTPPAMESSQPCEESIQPSYRHPFLNNEQHD